MGVAAAKRGSRLLPLKGKGVRARALGPRAACGVRRASMGVVPAAGDVHGIADDGEFEALLVADVAEDDGSVVHPDADAYRKLVLRGGLYAMGRHQGVSRSSGWP